MAVTFLLPNLPILLVKQAPCLRSQINYYVPSNRTNNEQIDSIFESRHAKVKSAEKVRVSKSFAIDNIDQTLSTSDLRNDSLSPARSY